MSGPRYNGKPVEEPNYEGFFDKGTHMMFTSKTGAPKVFTEEQNFVNTVAKEPNTVNTISDCPVAEIEGKVLERMLNLDLAKDENIARTCSSDVSMVNNINKKHDDDDDDPNANTSKILDLLVNSANGSTVAQLELALMTKATGGNCQENYSQYLSSQGNVY